VSGDAPVWAHSLIPCIQDGLSRALVECIEKNSALSFYASDIPAAGHERKPQSK